MKNNKGFTLIELLVVISIISLLSSIVLSSISSARDKAAVAAGQQFSGQTYRALGWNALALWNFNEESPTADAQDFSGNNHNLTDTGTIVKADSPLSSGKSAQFGGLSYYLWTAPTGYTGFKFPNSQYTISLWVKPTNLTNGPIIIWANVSTGADRFFNIQLPSDGGIVVGSCGQFQRSSNFNPTVGKWQHIAYSYTNGSFYVYVNGRQIDKLNAAPTCLGAYSTLVGVGGFFGGGSTYNFNGSLDEVAIYTEALTAYEVQQIFANSAIKHGFALK